ncbi:MAG: hypothetical protein WA771_08135 [Chthoniobacterales bacterium]
MKPALLSLSLVTICLASCTTLENRRYMYCGNDIVCGPYTKMLCGHVIEKQEIETTVEASDYKSYGGK